MISGSSICRNERQRLAPSMAAASSSVFGMVVRAAEITNRTKGVPIQISTTVTDINASVDFPSQIGPSIPIRSSIVLMSPALGFNMIRQSVPAATGATTNGTIRIVRLSWLNQPAARVKNASAVPNITDIDTENPVMIALFRSERRKVSSLSVSRKLPKPTDLDGPSEAVSTQSLVAIHTENPRGYICTATTTINAGTTQAAKKRRSFDRNQRLLRIPAVIEVTTSQSARHYLE